MANNTKMSSLCTIEELQSFANFNKTDNLNDSWYYISPILLIIGFTENALAIFVLPRRKFKSSPVICTLFMLSLNDLLTVILSHTQWILATHKKFILMELGHSFCRASTYLVLVTSQISSMLVAMLSVIRMCSISELPKAQNPTIDRRISPLVAFLIMLINFLPLYYTTFNVADKFENNLACRIPEPSWKLPLNTYWCTMEKKFLVLLDTIDMSLLVYLPLIIMALCNIKIILRIQKQSYRMRKNHALRSSDLHKNLSIKNKQGKNSFPTKSNQMLHGKRKRDTRITLTLTAITITFLCFNVPFSIVRISESLFRKPSKRVEFITKLLSYLSNCSNFIIYTVIQDSFREELKLLFYNCIPKLFKCKWHIVRKKSLQNLEKRQSSNDSWSHNNTGTQYIDVKKGESAIKHKNINDNDSVNEPEFFERTN